MIIYFAEDGSYGTAEEFKVFDTSKWTQDDWTTIEECRDEKRLSIAVEINEKRLSQDHPLRELA
jgi:hypothetical protein